MASNWLKKNKLTLDMKKLSLKYLVLHMKQGVWGRSMLF